MAGERVFDEDIHDLVPPAGSGRFVPVRAFTCPNHPHGPPDNDVDGLDDLTLVLNRLHAVWPRWRALERARAAIGLCCDGHEWVDVLDADGNVVMREMGTYEAMLRDFTVPLARGLFQAPIVLRELEHGELGGRKLKVPLIFLEPDE